ncbi:unnamed protein product [Diplocarpon coronariae]
MATRYSPIEREDDNDQKENLPADSSIDLKPSISQSSSVIRSRWLHPLLLSISFLVVFSIITLAPLISYQEASDKNSPIPALPLETVIFQNYPDFGDAPNPKNDAMWMSLLGPGMGTISIHNPIQYGFPRGIPAAHTPGSQVYGISMYHQLHCLIIIRKLYWGAMRGEKNLRIAGGEKEFAEDVLHVSHCFDYIRQGIMCAGDMSLEGAASTDVGKESNVDGMGWPHQCRSWNASRWPSPEQQHVKLAQNISRVASAPISFPRAYEGYAAPSAEWLRHSTSTTSTPSEVSLNHSGSVEILDGFLHSPQQERESSPALRHNASNCTLKALDRAMAPLSSHSDIIDVKYLPAAMALDPDRMFDALVQLLKERDSLKNDLTSVTDDLKNTRLDYKISSKHYRELIKRSGAKQLCLWNWFRQMCNTPSWLPPPPLNQPTEAEIREQLAALPTTWNREVFMENWISEGFGGEDLWETTEDGSEHGTENGTDHSEEHGEAHGTERGNEIENEGRTKGSPSSAGDSIGSKVLDPNAQVFIPHTSSRVSRQGRLELNHSPLKSNNSAPKFHSTPPRSSNSPRKLPETSTAEYTPTPRPKRAAKFNTTPCPLAVHVPQPFIIWPPPNVFVNQQTIPRLILSNSFPDAATQSLIASLSPRWLAICPYSLFTFPSRCPLVGHCRLKPVCDAFNEIGGLGCDSEDGVCPFPHERKMCIEQALSVAGDCTMQYRNGGEWASMSDEQFRVQKVAHLRCRAHKETCGLEEWKQRMIVISLRDAHQMGTYN